MRKTLAYFLTLLLLAGTAGAQNRVSTQPHTGSVTGIIGQNGEVFTAGQDGFIIKWNAEGQGEHYQVSDLEIRCIALHPNGTTLAVYETDGYAVNRLSVWDWKTKTRKFAKRLASPATYLSFSERGTYVLVGTNAVEGILFVNSSNGSAVKKLRDIPGMVTFAKTSDTENSCVMYSQLGSLVYANIKNRTTKTEMAVEPYLEQCVLFNNNLLFAGYKAGYIYLYHAANARLLAKIEAPRAIIASTKKSADLYFTVVEGRNYMLKMAETQDVTALATAPASLIVKNFFPENRAELSTVTLEGQTLFAGCTNGSVQSISYEPDTELASMQSISEDCYAKITDVETVGDNFYILAEQGLFKTSYRSKALDLVMENPGYTNVLSLDDNTLLFWSAETRSALATATYTENGGWKTRMLYTPSASVLNVHYQNNHLVIIEGSSRVTLYSFETNSAKTIYSGTGVQDALLFNNETLYVAKSAATSPKSALIEVDVATQETLALPVPAEVSFSLTNGPENSGTFYGVSVFSDSSSRQTELFAYQPGAENAYTVPLRLTDEDTQAITYYRNGRIYTNIGKAQIRSFSVTNKRVTRYNRYNSLPVKITANNTHLLVLNRDGSVSWLSGTSNTLYGTWYLTKDTTWIMN